MPCLTAINESMNLEEKRDTASKAPTILKEVVRKSIMAGEKRIRKGPWKDNRKNRHLNRLTKHINLGMECKYLLKILNQKVTSKGGEIRLHDVCAAKTKIVLIKTKPYSTGAGTEVLLNALSNCCGDFIKSFDIRNTSSLSKDNGTALKSGAAFIFPVFSYANSEIVYGHYYIPLYDTPGAFYVTAKQHFNLSDLVNRCFSLWPLLAICIFMAIIAGWIAWLLDTWSNKEEFPRVFFRGWFEGENSNSYYTHPSILYNCL